MFGDGLSLLCALVGHTILLHAVAQLIYHISEIAVHNVVFGVLMQSLFYFGVGDFRLMMIAVIFSGAVILYWCSSYAKLGTNSRDRLKKDN